MRLGQPVAVEAQPMQARKDRNILQVAPLANGAGNCLQAAPNRSRPACDSRPT